MTRLPKELQYLIASYAVSPVYRLAHCLHDHIHWEGLAHNPHPGMIPLIDAYFERCLTVQSHLDWTILYHLQSNPIATPLLEKYQYFTMKYKSYSHFHNNTKSIVHIIKPWNGHEPTDWLVDATAYDFSSHPRIMEYIKNGSIRVKALPLALRFALYINPAIFEVDPIVTQEVYTKWVSEIKN